MVKSRESTLFRLLSSERRNPFAFSFCVLDGSSLAPFKAKIQVPQKRSLDFCLFGTKKLFLRFL